MRVFFLFFVIFSSLIFANAVDITKTDFIERTANFIIFVIILWYLLAGKAKAFFGERREKIAQQLSDVQEKLKIAKNNKEQALRKLEEAREQAGQILANAKKEAYLIAQKIEEQSGIDIEIMRKNLEILMEFEQRKMEKEVVDEVLQEVFAQSGLNTTEYVNILEKKVV